MWRKVLSKYEPKALIMAFLDPDAIRNSPPNRDSGFKACISPEKQVLTSDSDAPEFNSHLHVTLSNFVNLPELFISSLVDSG